MSKKKGYITVVCQNCDAEYEMPDVFGVKPVMEDCPACKDVDKIKKALSGVLGEIDIGREK